MSDQNKKIPEDANDEKNRRDVVAGPVWKLKTEVTAQLSPISEIVATLEEASIATPKTTKQKTTKLETLQSDRPENQLIKQDTERVKIDDDDEDMTEGLITNTFVINSAGISPATRQREQRARAVQRRANIAPTHVNFDIKCDSPEKDSNSMSEDISFYASSNRASSPQPCPISPCRDDANLLSPGTSPSMFTIGNVGELPRHDSTSMDSGYSGHSHSNNRLSHSSGSSSSAFQFVEPKRPSTSATSSPPAQRTPSKYTLSNSMNSSGTGFAIFHSLSSGSGESIDDDYMELMDMESMDDEDAQMPTDLSSLICKDIKTTTKTPENKRPDSFVRKCLNMEGGVKNSLFSSPSTPKTSTITSLITTPERQCLQNISENITSFGHRSSTTGAFKRPEPPAMSPIQSKRYKCENEPPTALMQFPLPQSHNKRPIFRKSMSMNDAFINDALSRPTSESNLIGDFTRSHCLPTIDGKHSDLKSISSDTMRKLLLGEFEDNVASFKVIDCRYPYEYQGGHIRGAFNLYTQEQILEELVNNKIEQKSCDATKRNILVFHCEFSSERGPKLSRFLRQHDRNLNIYPSLQYPEIYLLHGGYKEFFEMNSDLCDPQSYRPMIDPQFSDEYRLCRAKTKSWSGDTRATVRLTKSRSRLVL